MGKGGGGYDAGPMLEYGDKALALQRQMYDESVQRTQPYYDTGTSALDMLADALGIKGGSVQSRDQIYNDMMPQYTTTETYGGGGESFSSPDGRVFTRDNYGDVFQGNDRDAAQIYMSALDSGSQDLGAYQDMGYGVVGGGQQSRDVTDYNALNSAVDERFGAQGTPDNYGTLLQPFGMDQFEADPGYQFRMDEGNKAIERAASARGQYYDPSTSKALIDYSSNMADQTYGDAYNRYNNDQNQIFNRLAAVSGIGQTANNTLNNAGSNYANQAGNIYGQQGSAIMEANAANAAQPSMFDTLLGAGVQLGGAYLGNPMAFGR